MSLPKKKNSPLLFAHRGGNLAPENSLEAFKKAKKLGYTHFETDAIITSDKVILAFHGSSGRLNQLRTSTPRRSYLQSLSFDEARLFLLRYGIEALPLKILLKELPESFFSIDAKTSEVVEPLSTLIDELEAHNRVSVTSFSFKRALRLRTLTPEIIVGQCISRYYAPFFKLFKKRTIKRLKKHGIAVIHFPYEQVTSGLVSTAHKFNVQVWVWTVNDKKNMEKMRRLGVDSIISDEVRMLSDAFKQSK